MTNDTTKETAAPFSEANTKQQLVSHLIEVHGLHSAAGKSLYVNAKRVGATKAELVRVHDRLHLILDSPNRGWDEHYQTYRRPDMRSTAPRPTVDHVHEEVAVGGQVASALEALRTNGGPLVEGGRLSASERSALTRLVDNDYAALAADLRSLAAQAQENDLAQLKLDWADRREQAQTWVGKVNALREQITKEIETMKKEAVAAGIELRFPYASRDHLTVEAATAGYDKAVSEAKNRNRRLLDAALLKLERERLRAQRRILLSAVTPQAAEILETIPSAQQMLNDAMTRDAAPVLEGA
jgi:hypothetical protein